MTVLNSTNIATGSGNGSATLFSFSPVRIYDESEIEFYIVSPAGVETQVAQGTGADKFEVVVTLEPNTSATGSVRYPQDEVTPLPSGWSWIVRRKLPLTQTTALRNQGGYLPQVQEEVFDRLVMIAQQQQEEIDRKLGVSISSSTDVETLTANIATLTAIESDISTVAGISSDVTAVAADATDIGTVASNISDVNTVSANIADIGTVASNDANITTVASDITNVNTVAGNITGVNSFAERYRVASSDPSTSLDEGDLVYNTTDNALKYYDGASWNSIAPGISNVVDDTTPQLGGNLDVNGNSIVSVSNGDIPITPNGTGKIILDGLSWPTADGSVDQVLKTDGSGNLSFADAGGGGWVPISTQTVSTAVASVDFTSGIDSTYSLYRVRFSKVQPSVDNRDFIARTGNGGSFDSGASDYKYDYEGAGGGTLDSVIISPGNGNDTQEYCSGVIYIVAPSNASYNTQFYGQSVGTASNGTLQSLTFAGERSEAAAHDRLQFLFRTSGNINAGAEFVLEGLA